MDEDRVEILPIWKCGNVKAHHLSWNCWTKLESLLGQALGRLGDGNVDECVKLDGVVIL
jgi:hypothetical protein